jgi:hypothetical protein
MHPKYKGRKIRRRKKNYLINMLCLTNLIVHQLAIY